VKTATVATVTITARSIMAMNQAALLAVFGVGWVMPKVLMKIFARKSSGFMSFRKLHLQGRRSIYFYSTPIACYGVLAALMAGDYTK
jgi:hypothetical protein